MIDDLFPNLFCISVKACTYVHKICGRMRALCNPVQKKNPKTPPTLHAASCGIKLIYWQIILRAGLLGRK